MSWDNTIYLREVSDDERERRTRLISFSFQKGNNTINPIKSY